MELNNKIRLDEIKQRVDAKIGEVLAELPADAKRPKVRKIACMIGGRLDPDLAGAILLEGLVRVVRNQMRVRNRSQQASKRKGKG